jgi:thioesterase domain-containing protein
LRTALPVFVVGGVGGNVNNLRELALEIGVHRPFIGLQTRGVLGHRMFDTIEEAARDHLVNIRRHQAKGPYLLAGYSGGSFVAFEMAQQLRANGEEVGFLGILDSAAPKFAFMKGGSALARLKYHATLLLRHGPRPIFMNAKSWVGNKLQPDALVRFGAKVKPEDYRHIQLTRHALKISEAYDPKPYSDDAWLFLTESDLDGFSSVQLRKSDPLYGWKPYVQGELRVETYESSHLKMLKGKAVKDLAAMMEAEIQRTKRGG